MANHNPKFFDGSTRDQPELHHAGRGSRRASSTPRDILGEGWFLLDVQVHKANPDAELVEGGQLLALWVHPDVGMLPRKEHGNRHDDNHARR